MGIRKRVRRAFFALATILLFAGVSSYFEMVVLIDSSKKLVEFGAESVRVSTKMLDLSKLHNDVFYEYSQDKDIQKLRHDSEKILFSLDSISDITVNTPRMEMHFRKIFNDIENYKKGIRAYYNVENIKDDNWYYYFQSDVYFTFVKSMKQFMVSSQEEVVVDTTKIGDGIYRSIMLGLVSIVFMIFILIIFFVLLDIYYLKPVVKLTNSLDSYLVSKTPFVVKVDGRDEVYKLKELILDLISANKSLGRDKTNLFSND